MTSIATRSCQFMVTVGLIVILSGCHKALVDCSRAQRLPEPPAPAAHPDMVLFATDREPRPRKVLSFSGERNLSTERLTYGIKCESPDGGSGSCGSSSGVLDRQDFLNRVNSSGKDILLFIHGYRYSFDESLQIATRLVQRTGVDALPVAYSWPSQNRLLAYGKDYDVNEWTFEHLTGFLQDVVNSVPEGHVLHIVAHSMGNRAALECLARLQLPKERLGQLVMIAPDVDAQTFAELFLRSGDFKRRTLYVSNHDLALGFSRVLHSRTPRAGDAKRGYVVADGLDTIDASPLSVGVIGHSYYETSQLMFDDLAAVLKGKSLAERHLDTCKVKGVLRKNAKNGTLVPATIYRLPYNTGFTGGASTGAAP